MQNHTDLFEALVKEAIDQIPEEYAEVHENVIFRVEDVPTPEQRASLNLHPRAALYGLFEGVPRTGRSSGQSGMLPAIITVYRYPMIRIHRTYEDLKKQIYETVWHEVAHYFGLNHEAIHRVQGRHGDD